MTPHLNRRLRSNHQKVVRTQSPGYAQRFLAAYGPLAAHFRPRRHRLAAATDRETRDQRCATWRAVIGLPAAA